MAIIKQGGGTVKVMYVSDLTNSKGKTIKKNVKGFIVMHIADIMAIDVYYDNKLMLNHNKCRIFHEQLGWLVLNEPFDEMAHIKMDGTIQVKGFVQKKKKINNTKINNTKIIKNNAKSRRRNS
jgi:hypothetical protein